MVYVAAARDRKSIPADTATANSDAAGIGAVRSVPAGTGTAAGTCARAHAPQPSAVTDADLERLADEIAELAAHVHAATYRLLVRLRDFDERAGWGGFRSCAHWLSWRTGIGLGAAREKVRVARALERLPRLGEAMRRGELSFAKVRAASRVATPENEEQLLELAVHGTASHMEKVVRAWRRVDRLAEQAEEQERHRSRTLALYVDDDGMYVVRGRLDPEVGALLERALTVASEALYGRNGAADAREADAAAGMEPATVEQRRADAIGLIAACALRVGLASAAQPDADAVAPRPGKAVTVSRDVGMVSREASTVSQNAGMASQGAGMASQGAGIASLDAGKVSRDACIVSRESGTVSLADRFQVVVHVDAEALRQSADSGQSAFAGGGRVSAETSRRLACDASRVVMTHDENGSVLDVGRRSRAVPPAIRRALEHRDRGCRFPGCGLHYCDAHHVVHWADGGATRLDNLVRLCRRHHRAVHEDGFRVAVTNSGEIRFYRPDGRPLRDAPAAPRLPDDPGAALAAAHSGLGLEIDASTAASFRAGKHLDLDFALLTLRGA